MLQCFRLCATSEISTALIFTHWNEKILYDYQVSLTSFFSYIESCLPVQKCMFTGEWELLWRHRKVSAQKCIFSPFKCFKMQPRSVKDIHFSIHTTWSMSVFFLFWNQRCTRYKTTCNSSSHKYSSLNKAKVGQWLFRKAGNKNTTKNTFVSFD